MIKLRTHSPEFKFLVTTEEIIGRKTIQEIAADDVVHRAGESVEVAAAGLCQ